MTVSVPLITDPRDRLFGALPFVNDFARDQCLNAIRRAFDDTAREQESVRVMLHLATRNGPTLMEMVANVVRNGSELVAILTGREVDSGLAGLLHKCKNEGSATESAVVVNESNRYEERFRSASEEGSIKGGSDDDDEIPANTSIRQLLVDYLKQLDDLCDDTSSSVVSSLTTPTIDERSNANSGSTVSSLTMSTYSKVLGTHPT